MIIFLIKSTKNNNNINFYFSEIKIKFQCFEMYQFRETK